MFRVGSLCNMVVMDSVVNMCILCDDDDDEFREMEFN